MKAPKTKTCRTCSVRKRLYKKFNWSFDSTRLYYCAIGDCLTEMDGSCERWSKRRAEYDLSPRRFDKAEADIKYIAEHLQNEEDCL